MKNQKSFILSLFMGLAVASCEEPIDNLDVVGGVAAPASLGMAFDITQDNSGTVTVFPNAEGATSFEVDFGDGSEPETVPVGASAQHVYPEGSYSVSLDAYGINGLSASFEQQLTVSFRAPENIVVTVERDGVNPKIVHVSATADFATVMNFYFGDVEDEAATVALPGETVSHTYAGPGDHTLTVVAKSAAVQTTTHSETITIDEASDPVALPITFESFTVNYAFTSFGNAGAGVIDNPDMGEGNNSARVAEFVKPDGAETWAGTLLTLAEPMDFSTNTTFRVKVWSPKAGAVIRLKIENITDGSIFHELDATTTQENAWEVLSFDFSAVNQENSYQKVVLFFDFGNAGDNTTYYFDDILLGPSEQPSSLMVQDFEGEVPEFTVFGNIAAVEVIDNPDASGQNTTAKVAKLTKSAGSDTWAGAFFLTSPALDFLNYSSVALRVWSPKSGIVVKLKLENLDGSITHEVDVLTTTSNAWEKLTYDFSGAPAADYVKIVVFFDFDNAGDDTVYYYDEIELTN